MKRLLWMTPLVLLVFAYLSMFCTGLPLMSETMAISGTLPLAPTEEPLSAETTGATTRLVQNPGCYAHNIHGHLMTVATWLLIVPAALCPLLPAWRNTRRRKMALALSLLSLVAVLSLILLESFTGHLVYRMLRSRVDVVRGTYMRIVALHAMGLPFLILPAMGFWTWVQARLSKRAVGA